MKQTKPLHANDKRRGVKKICQPVPVKVKEKKR